MELKSFCFSRAKAAVLSFNRTFMELKYWSVKQITITKVFQSYLYGIEMGNCRGAVHKYY